MFNLQLPERGNGIDVRHSTRQGRQDRPQAVSRLEYFHGINVLNFGEDEAEKTDSLLADGVRVGTVDGRGNDLAEEIVVTEDVFNNR